MNARSWAAVEISHQLGVPLWQAEKLVAGLNTKTVAVIDLRVGLELLGMMQAIRELGLFPAGETTTALDRYQAEIEAACGL